MLRLSALTAGRTTVPGVPVIIATGNLAAMASTIRIRRARQDDIEAMQRLELASFPGDRLSRRAMRRLVGRDTAICLVAEDDTGPAGDAIVLLRRNSTAARLYSIAVDPDRRGSGIGTGLLAEAERLAGAAGRRRMTLEVREDNDAAIRRYLAAGYAGSGRKPDFYDDGAAALVMEKLLVPVPD
jgi:ribosomal-protein-alanine N-acetyltransferase